MSKTPKILAFAGSLREKSYNKRVLKIAIEGARKAGADVTFVDLKDYPKPSKSSKAQQPISATAANNND